SPSTLSGLAEHGRWWSTTLPGIDVAPTVTAVGWATILTGVWPDAHGVMGNEEELNRLHRYPELLTTAFCARPDLHTYGAASALGSAPATGWTGEPSRGNAPKPTRSSWRRPSTIFASTTRTSPSSTSGRPTRSPTSTGSAPSTRQPYSDRTSGSDVCCLR